MTESRRVPDATELVYVPRASWIPVFAAAGFAGVLAGLIAGIVWTIIGAIVLLVAVVSWFRSVGEDVARMPRSQRATTAVLPPIPAPTDRS